MKISRKKRVLWVGLSVTMGLLLSFAVVYAAIGITYEHWADEEMAWQANILNVGKADYAEGEVIPHFFQADTLVTGTVYYFDIEYDFYQNTSEACGFWQFNTWDLDRPGIEFNPNGVFTTTSDFDKLGFATLGSGLGNGELWYANVDDIEVFGPDEDLPYRYARVVYTPTNYTLPVEFYWGLQIGFAGQCNEPGVITDSVGATAWTGGSLQTSITCESPPPSGYTTVDCQGSGSLQADPSGIKPTAITGYKWFDTNGNGSWDVQGTTTPCVDPPAVGCEPPLKEWEIQAFLCPDAACATYPWGTMVVSDTTNLQGQYTLSGLTVGSTYRACEVIEPVPTPAQWIQTSPDPADVDMGCSPPITVESQGAGVLTTRQDFGNWYGRTAVTLSDFTATPQNMAVSVEWTTSMDSDTLGFNLYRSRNKNEKRMELLAYIPVEDNFGVGDPEVEYEYLDDEVRSGKKYYYWLEPVYIGIGKSTEVFGPIGPVRAPK